MEQEKVEFKFELGDITNKFLLHLKDTSDCVRQIYHAIDKLDIDISTPLPTNTLPFTIQNSNKANPTFHEQKQITLDWVFTKAFEEFINGLTKSFKEAYKYLKVFALHKELNYLKSREQLNEELQKIDAELDRLHFPDFLDRIEKLLCIPLPLKGEILSINQVRNCLVHRHGIVGDKDIKNSATSELSLKWITLKIWVEIEGKQVEMSYDLRKDGISVDSMSFKQVPRERAFRLGEKVLINIDEFNDISFTCSSFVSELMQLMPLPIGETKNAQ